jgi:hypothetical protein
MPAIATAIAASVVMMLIRDDWRHRRQQCSD